MLTFPLKAQKLLEDVKFNTVISSYTTEVLVAPAAGSVAIYIDIAAAKLNRRLEIEERLKDLIDAAREDNYGRPATTTIYYTKNLDGSNIVKTTNPLESSVVFAPTDGGSTISFVADTEIDTILDSGNRFVSSGLLLDQEITIANAATAGNNVTFFPINIVAGTISLEGGTVVDGLGTNNITFTGRNLPEVTRGMVAIAIGSTVLSGGKGSIIIDAAFREILDYVREQWDKTTP
jgi:hypothetical protein